MYSDLFNELEQEKARIIRDLRMLECLTEKRIKLIEIIRQRHPNSIRELSRLLDRDVKNVFDDLLLLQKNSFIKLEQVGRNKKPEVIIKKIIITYKED